MWEKEKVLVTINFSFSPQCFQKTRNADRKNQGLFGKGLKAFHVIVIILSLLLLVVIVVVVVVVVIAAVVTIIIPPPPRFEEEGVYCF